MPDRMNLMAVCGCGMPIEAVVAIAATTEHAHGLLSAVHDHQRATGCRDGRIGMLAWAERRPRFPKPMVGA